MSNSFLTVSEIAERSLPFLEANLAFAGAVNRDFDDSYARKGDTIQVRKPEVFTASEFDESSGVSFGEVAEESVNVQLDTVLTVDKKVGSKEMTMNIGDFEIQYIMPAMKGLAQKIDYNLSSLYKDVPYSIGTAGSTPDAISDITGVKRILEGNKAPRSPRYLVINEDAEDKFLQLDSFAEIDKSGDGAVMREGFLGRKYGFEIAMDQNIITHTKGTLAGTPLTNSATAGSTSVPVNGATADTTLLYGDLIAIAGNQYVVTADVTLALGAGNVSIYPALAADSNDEAVTVVSSAANNLGFHRDAFCLVNRPLEPAMGGAESATINVNGLAIRVTYGYDMTYKRHMLSWDMLTGFKTLYPELAVRLLG
jgi:hypothetical protein